MLSVPREALWLEDDDGIMRRNVDALSNITQITLLFLNKNSLNSISVILNIVIKELWLRENS